MLLKKTAYDNNAANYQIGQYASFADKAYALKVVQFERRLELALEGHRYYDLVRWGILKQVKESYSAFEGTFLPAYGGITVAPRNDYFPIPQTQIDRSLNNVKQNEGY